MTPDPDPIPERRPALRSPGSRSLAWLPGPRSGTFGRAGAARAGAWVLALLLTTSALGCEGGSDLPPERLTEEILRARSEGLTFLQRDELAEAETHFARLVELAPREPAGYANLALVHLRRGEMEEAEELIREARERAPADPEIALVLARIHEVRGQPGRARDVLRESLDADPDHLKTHWALAELAGDDRPADRLAHLREVVRVAPGNPAARLALAEAALGAGRSDEGRTRPDPAAADRDPAATHPDSAAAHLEALRQQVPRLPEEAREALDAAVEALDLGRTAEARSALRRFRELFRVTSMHQGALEDLRGPPGEMVGIPFLTFSHEFSLRVQEQDAVLAALRFRDATATSGLDEAWGAGGVWAVAHGDFDGDGDVDLFLAGGGGPGQLLRDDLGRFVDVTAEAGLPPVGGGAARGARAPDASAAPTDAIFADFDNDGHLDLLVLRSDGARLYRNTGEGTFTDVTAEAGIAAAGGRAAVFADLDHDGDLDLFVARDGPDRFYRNDGGGGFTERAAQAGLAGDGEARGRDVHFGDFDGDGDLDLLVLNEGGPPVLYDNLRGGRFEDVAARLGLGSVVGGEAAAVGDFDNDGRLDLFLAEAGGGGSLWRNGREGFEAVGGPVGRALADLRVTAAVFLDFDNDGRLDLLVAGTPAVEGASPLRLFHNGGPDGFEEMTERLPRAPDASEAAEAPGGRGPEERPAGEADAGVAGLAAYDYNEDGDLDLVVVGRVGARLLRNDGGNVNHYVKLRLRGLRAGSGKNNHFGIGSRVELRAGDLYQVRVATDPRVHFGLGSRLKADVVRVEWTNGTPQTLYYPGTDRDLEEQALKGSCPFLYTWDGEGFTFVKDIMWRSALGMPVGIMGGAEGGGRAYAPAEASREYLLIPGDVLAPRDGRYVLQITEELWEAVYVDEVRLVAVDHPDSVDLVVDEKFLPPGPARLRLHPVSERVRPRSATDGEGADLLDALRASDDRYVDNLVPGRYQGVVETHDLVLDFGDLSALEHPILVLRGWIFPTDASINVAMAQSGEGTTAPRLQVRDRSGEWRTVVDNAGIPSGKDKTVVVDLDGVFLSDDHRLRIRTDMRIYWDEAYVASSEAVTGLDGASPGPGAELRATRLDPAAADLHYRGFSRLYRKGGRHGPHWFDYDDVSTEPAWRDLVGSYTRYGDVRPLLLEPDDRYVILNAGDEMTVEFDAEAAPPLPDGWRRDFLLYTVGWIKDGDLNTATGGTVEPLPFHGMTRYPYGADESYPDGPEHRRFREEYLTRRVEPRF